MNYGSTGGLATTGGALGTAVIGGYYVSGLGLAVAAGVALVVIGAVLYRFGRRKGKRVSA